MDYFETNANVFRLMKRFSNIRNQKLEDKRNLPSNSDNFLGHLCSQHKVILIHQQPKLHLNPKTQSKRYTPDI